MAKNISFLILLLTSLISCKNSHVENKKLLVCSTSILADCVQAIVGDKLEVQSLMHAGVDPHAYKPRPRDVELLNDAHLILYTGFHLEGKMASLFENLEKRKNVFSLEESFPKNQVIFADSITPDPHIWFDVLSWTESLEGVVQKLTSLYPEHQVEFERNYASFKNRAIELSSQMQDVLNHIPMKNRVLITSHDAFHYFGRAFNIRIKALQGVSTIQEPGIKDVVDLSRFIVRNDIRAVFIENSVSPKVLYSVMSSVKNKGHQLVVGGTLYSDALGEKGSGADTYFGMIEYNVKTISKGLRHE